MIAAFPLLMRRIRASGGMLVDSTAEEELVQSYNRRTTTELRLTDMLIFSLDVPKLSVHASTYSHHHALTPH
jgi:hypothetical protein